MVLAFCLSEPKGDILNLRDLERTVQSLNRLESIAVKLSIEPGTKVGYSVVNLKMVQGPAYGGSLRYNTYSNAKVPVYPTTAQFRMENITNLWESLDISLSQSNESGGQNTQSVGVYAQLPFAKYKAGINASHFEYTRFINSLYDQTVLAGQSKSVSLGLEREFGRIRSSQWSGFTRLSIVSKENHVDTVLTPASTHRLVDIEIGIRHLYRHQNTLISSSLSLLMGINRWSRFELPQQSIEDPFSSAKILMASSTLSRNINMWKWPFQLLWTVRGQWSPSILHAERQMVLGSYYAVRGFNDPYDSEITDKDTQAVGDSGAISRLELSLPLARKWNLRSLSGWSPYIHLDVGAVVDNLGDSARQDRSMYRIISQGFGLKWDGKRHNFNASLSKIVKATDSVYHPGWVKAFSINFNF